MTSLRARLNLWLLVGVTVFLAANGAAIYWVVRARLVAEVDRSLVELAQSLIPPVMRELSPGRPQPGPRWVPRDDGDGDGRPPRPRPEPAVSPLMERTDVLFQTWLELGQYGPHSELLSDVSLPRLAEGAEPVGFEQLDESALRFDFVELALEADGAPARWRALGLRVQPPEPRGAPRAPRPVELVLAKDVRELDATLAQLRWLLLFAWLSASLGCAAILSFVVHRSLAPLRRLDRQLEALDATKLDQRFDTAGAPDELVPVLEQLDASLARIRVAFEREQAFSAYAAHELRTPLAGLRATLELAAKKERTPDEHREAERASLAIALELQALVERLLELSRAGAGQPVGEPEPVDLAALVERAVAARSGAAAARGLSFDVRAPESLVIDSDPRLIARVVENLVDNAVEHADAGGHIGLSLAGDAERWQLGISNPAADAPADLPERCFDAFWRADAARSATGRHAGLGLALCQRIAQQLGHSIDARLADGRFTVTLQR